MTSIAKDYQADLATTESKSWTTAEKIGFRFVFVLFILFITIVNNGAFPFFDELMVYPTGWLHTGVVWIGKNVIHLSYDITTFTNGSGDTTYDYVLLLCCFITAVISTIIWSIFDRNSNGYPKLYYWLTVIVRFYVAFMLMNYGFSKVFKTQFPYPLIHRLYQPYGNSSPMGLAWSFLGLSRGYNWFMGIAEIATGLLLFRRTLTLGTLITLVTVANIVAVNYFFDVPVKIVSSTLLVMTLFLLSRDIRRLAAFFLTGKAISLPVIPHPFVANKKYRIAAVIFKTIFIGYAIYSNVMGGINSRNFYETALQAKTYGAYRVEHFIIGKDTIPPLTTNLVRWKLVTIDQYSRAKITYMNDSASTYWQFSMDTLQRSVAMKLIADTTQKFAFDYHTPGELNYVIKGKILNDTVSIYLKRINSRHEDFLLTNRGFHWINELPFNR